MKTPILVLTLLASAAIGGIVVYMITANKTSQSQAPVTASVSADTTPAPVAPEKVTPASQPAAPAPAASASVQVASTTPVDSNPKSNDSTNAIHKLVDDLLSAKNGQDKHNMFQQLAKSGQLEQAIAELKQRALDNPNDPNIPTTLGEAQLNQVRVLKEAGAEVNELGILAMQADQSFNAALKIDPSNYEAQLVKSISMTYWPADPTRDAQVVQTLSGLIDQQETMPQNPGFAQTYLYLGNEYQKIGQPEKANATWQLGLQKFPNNPELQQKLNGP